MTVPIRAVANLDHLGRQLDGGLESSRGRGADGPRPHTLIPGPLSTDTPTVLWTLRNGPKQLTCSVQLLPHGLHLHLALNGNRPYCSRIFQSR